MPATDKSALRATARAARGALSPDERAAASARAVARLEYLPEMRRARVVLLYAASPQEIDPAGLVPRLRARGVRTLYPRVDGDRLELAVSDDPGALLVGFRGIREPLGPAIDPSVVDLAVVPGVAFDPAGVRLGQGGGHYDRLLAALPRTAVRVGVCFACQVVPRVPREPHDVPVDVVVTERVTHRVDERGRRIGRP
ncbi:5-formyltetrahydrofolate cyclo-ligase [Egicoccus sp. AB-alg6-2]|uniref:5-formyltetrahydrofolate cyclo-ligase n=1 Tax=Egicoccus sp. AB-alg6-2 TaxID=3242692 RepID=UPI00359EFE35